MLFTFSWFLHEKSIFVDVYIYITYYWQALNLPHLVRLEKIQGIEKTASSYLDKEQEAWGAGL